MIVSLRTRHILASAWWDDRLKNIQKRSCPSWPWFWIQEIYIDLPWNAWEGWMCPTLRSVWWCVQSLFTFGLLGNDNLWLCVSSRERLCTCFSSKMINQISSCHMASLTRKRSTGNTFRYTTFDNTQLYLIYICCLNYLQTGSPAIENN